jgi:hypothetical protein
MALAELEGGWEIWLQFAVEAGAIDAEEQRALAHRCSRALGELAALQAPYQIANDPALRFMALLQSALASGRAHVADRLGGAPVAAELWGWRRQPKNERGSLMEPALAGWRAVTFIWIQRHATNWHSRERESAGF